MKHFINTLTLIVMVILISSRALSQGHATDFPNYGSGSQVLAATPATHGGTTAAFWNPASWESMRGGELAFSWSDRNVKNHRMDNWGLAVGGEGFGFTMRRNTFAVPDSADPQRTERLDDYQLAFADDFRGVYWGVAYGWWRGSRRELPRDDRDDHVVLGLVYRPYPRISAGGSAAFGIKRGDNRGIADLGIRPFGNHRLTAFADAAFGGDDNPTTMQWGIGLESWPIDGVRLAGKMSKFDPLSNDKVFTLSLGICWESIGFHAVPHYDDNSHRRSTDYLIRLGNLEPELHTPAVRWWPPHIRNDDSRSAY